MKKNTLMALCLVLVLLLSLCGCAGEKEEAYRMIQVLEVSGSVSVERKSMGTMDAYEGMRLESGDKITVSEESWLKMKMDEDKYALVEPGSVVRLEASGSSADSKTVLHLESGAISNRLEGKLSDGSSYEVNTPNSTMAVRGTVFRVEVTISEDGVSISNVSVYGGSVASRLVQPDGTTDSEAAAILIVSGTGVQIRANDVQSRYVTTDSKLNLNELKQKTLEFLQEAQIAGQNLEISSGELEELITALEQGTGEEETTAPTEEATEPTEETTASTTPPATDPPATDPPATDPPATDPPATEPPATEPPATDPPATDPPATNPPATDPPATEPVTYTVTFQNGGETFATQTVTSGETATAPKLQPTASGSWNFDFATPITQDTVIEWIAS